MNLIAMLMQSEGEIPSGVGAGIGIGLLVFWLLFVVLMIAAMWKVFEKAGEPGWAAIIPIYNLVILVKIAGRPLWWVVLFLVPFVNFIIAIIVSIDIAKAFGRGTGFGLGLALLSPIFYPILAWGDSRYQGPAVART